MHPDPVPDPCREAIARVAQRSAGRPVDESMRVTANFHPDRWADGRLTIEAMAESGEYRSQFVTGTSSGGLTARVGGDRWRWESRLFGGAYDDAPPALRPVYGALNFRRYEFGGSVRFGSCHLRFHRAAVARCTFCYPDSTFEPESFGTADHMALCELAELDGRDLLDDYVEAHVHGPVRFDRDVEAIVLDPSFADSRVADAVGRLGCAVEWHVGLVLEVDELRRHPDYRGPEFVELGCRIAEDGLLNARIVGDASRFGEHSQQALKKVWHYVARFGRPVDEL